MPYKSESQRRLMEGIRHGWKPTGLASPPTKAVAEEFHKASATSKALRNYKK